jgi:hypothetical protein
VWLPLRRHREPVLARRRRVIVHRSDPLGAERGER